MDPSFPYLEIARGRVRLQQWGRNSSRDRRTSWNKRMERVFKMVHNETLARNTSIRTEKECGSPRILTRIKKTKLGSLDRDWG